MPTDSRQVVKALAAVDPSALVTRCRADRLAHLAGALGVPKSGPKAAVASRIVARASSSTGCSTSATTPAAMARTFRAESLRPFASQLGLFLGVSKVRARRSGARPA